MNVVTLRFLVTVVVDIDSIDVVSTPTEVVSQEITSNLESVDYVTTVTVVGCLPEGGRP